MKAAFSQDPKVRKKVWEGGMIFVQGEQGEAPGPLLILENGWQLGWAVEKGLWTPSSSVARGD